MADTYHQQLEASVRGGATGAPGSEASRGRAVVFGRAAASRGFRRWRSTARRDAERARAHLFAAATLSRCGRAAQSTARGHRANARPVARAGRRRSHESRRDVHAPRRGARGARAPRTRAQHPRRRPQRGRDVAAATARSRGRASRDPRRSGERRRTWTTRSTRSRCRRPHRRVQLADHDRANEPDGRRAEIALELVRHAQPAIKSPDGAAASRQWCATMPSACRRRPRSSRSLRGRHGRDGHDADERTHGRDSEPVATTASRSRSSPVAGRDHLGRRPAVLSSERMDHGFSDMGRDELPLTVARRIGGRSSLYSIAAGVVLVAGLLAARDYVKNPDDERGFRRAR